MFQVFDPTLKKKKKKKKTYELDSVLNSGTEVKVTTEINDVDSTPNNKENIETTRVENDAEVIDGKLLAIE